VSLLSRLRDALFSGGAPVAVSNGYTSTQLVHGSQAYLDIFGPVPTVPVPTEQTIMSVSAVFGCVFLLSGAISSLPVQISKVDGKGFHEEIPDDPLWWILNEQMTPRWSAAIGWEFLSMSLLLLGNAYARILRGPDAMPIGIQPIHPSRVRVFLDVDNDRLIYSVDTDPAAPIADIKGGPKIYDQDDILHVPGLGFDGLMGMSPLRHALRVTGGVALATQDFSAAFFANSARPDYALATEKELSKEAIETMRAQIDERHRGPANAFRPMVLHGGLDIKNITMPIEDMQLLGIRQFQVEEIARVYGVPPFMIGHNEKTTSWGSGVEAMAIGFERFTLRPYLTKIENEFNRKLIRRGNRRLTFDTSDLQRADMKTFMEGLRAGVGRAGERQLISLNEARRKMRLKPTPGGDAIQTTDTAPATAQDTQNAQSQTV
jgi:HK97 family phage portal protein